jgi:putative transposase
MEETYARIKGVRKYLYRAAYQTGTTVDFLLTVKRDGGKRFGGDTLRRVISL